MSNTTELDNIVSASTMAGASLVELAEKGTVPLVEQTLSAILKVDNPAKKAELMIKLIDLINRYGKSTNKDGESIDHLSVISELRRD